jgi:hypothetical protein
MALFRRFISTEQTFVARPFTKDEFQTIPVNCVVNNTGKSLDASTFTGLINALYIIKNTKVLDELGVRGAVAIHYSNNGAKSVSNIQHTYLVKFYLTQGRFTTVSSFRAVTSVQVGFLSGIVSEIVVEITGINPALVAIKVDQIGSCVDRTPATSRILGQLNMVNERILTSPPTRFGVDFNFSLGTGNASFVAYLEVDIALLTSFFQPRSFPALPATIAADTCPLLRVFYSTDLLTGNDIAQVVLYQPGGPYYTQYLPEFQEYLITVGVQVCPNYSTKIRYIAFRDYQPDQINVVGDLIMVYGLVRYFLWFLITGQFDLSILLQRRNGEFALALLNSSYACWITFFTNSIYAAMGQYYIV